MPGRYASVPSASNWKDESPALPPPPPPPKACVFSRRRRLLHCKSSSLAARADHLDWVAQDSVLGSTCCFNRSWNQLSLSLSPSLSLSCSFSFSFSFSLDLFPLLIDLLSLFLSPCPVIYALLFLLLSSLFCMLSSFPLLLLVAQACTATVDRRSKLHCQ